MVTHRYAGLWLFLAVLMTGAVARPTSDFYQLSFEKMDGKRGSFAQHRGKAMLIFNMATHCGFTPQLAGLQKLHQQYKAKGLVVIGIPSNDFGGQAPGVDADILKFSESKYQTDFNYIKKSSAKGPNIDPVFAHLVKSTGGQAIRWNFEKFLVDRNGKVVDRFSSGVDPLAPKVTSAIERVLKP